MKLSEKLITDAYGNITIHMEGDLNFSHGDHLKEFVSDILANNPYIDVKFDFTKVELVGSTGVSHFVDTVKYFQTEYSDRNIKLSNVSPYFKRLFKIYDLDEAGIYLDFGLDDKTTENLNKKFGNRKYTFEN